MAVKDITEAFLLKTATGSDLINTRKVKLLHNLEPEESVYKYRHDRLMLDVPASVIDHFYSCYITCSYTFNNGVSRDYGYLSLKYNPDTDSYQGSVNDFEYSKSKHILKEITFSFVGENELKEDPKAGNTYFKILSYCP